MQVDAVASAHGSQRNLFGGEGGWVGREGSDWNSLFFSRFSERFKGIRIFKIFKYINRKFGNPSHEERVSVLAKNKTEGLDLTNHMTGWNCLCKLWDGDENIKTQLQHMGYGPTMVRLISRGESSILTTGRKGKCLRCWKSGFLWGYERNKLKT